MAYIPPHKRHSKDTEKTSPTPSLFIPKFEKNLNLRSKFYSQRRKDQDSLQGGKIIYGKHSISRWWAVGFQDDGHLPPSIRLEPISCEQVEKKWGEKPLTLVCEIPSKDVNSIPQSSGKSPWVYITEKVQPDLHSSFENVRNEMEFEKTEEVKPSFAARFGKVLFHGNSSTSLDAICKSLVAETSSRNEVKKSFYTNVPSVYLEAVQCSVIPNIGVVFESDKERYHVKVYDKSRPDATISCKCSLAKDGELELHKVELNKVRHFVADISCLDKDLDLRLMLSSKRILTALADEEEKAIRDLIKFAIVDPDVKGGLRWPLGKESLGDRFCVVGVWHIKYKAYRSPTLRLKLRDADRFDFRTSVGEVAREVTLKMTEIAKQLRDGLVEAGALNKTLLETLKMIWENFLSCNCSFT